MKRIALLLIFALDLSAAITTGPTVNWDVRTTASDSNGGAFDTGVVSPGTNESLADAGTAVTVTINATTTKGTSSPAFSATTHGPGNIYNQSASAGCTAGRFEILSQLAGLATFDRSLGTALAVCTGTLGGSLATLATVASATISGNIVNVKAGTYTQTIALLFKIPSIWIGYGANQGDRGTKPLITTSTDSITLLNPSTATVANFYITFQNFSFSSTASTRGPGVVGLNTAAIWAFFTDCVFDGFSIALNQTSNSLTLLSLQGIEVKNSVSHGIVTKSPVNAYASYIHDNGGSGIVAAASGISLNFANSIISKNANGVTIASGVNFILTLNACAVANNTTDGVDFGTGSAFSTMSASNTIFYGNGRYNVNFSGGVNPGAGMVEGEANAYGGAGTANFNNVLGSPGDIALGANPFTSATNFALNSTANGGALLKSLGFPGVFPGGTTTGTINVGPVQASSAGGGQAAYPR
jgi:hypothetical protein